MSSQELRKTEEVPVKHLVLHLKEPVPPVLHLAHKLGSEDIYLPVRAPAQVPS